MICYQTYLTSWSSSTTAMSLYFALNRCCGCLINRTILNCCAKLSSWLEAKFTSPNRTTLGASFFSSTAQWAAVKTNLFVINDPPHFHETSPPLLSQPITAIWGNSVVLTRTPLKIRHWSIWNRLWNRVGQSVRFVLAKYPRGTSFPNNRSSLSPSKCVNIVGNWIKRKINTVLTNAMVSSSTIVAFNALCNDRWTNSNHACMVDIYKRLVFLPPWSLRTSLRCCPEGGTEWNKRIEWKNNSSMNHDWPVIVIWSASVSISLIRELFNFKIAIMIKNSSPKGFKWFILDQI